MSMDDLVGTQIDEYLLEDLLGEGGMARVYRGQDVNLQRYAAIKIITPAFRQEQDYLDRFEREARAIARLEHPHIVRLYRFGEANGLLYMAMQFIEGMDLESVLQNYRQSDETLEFPEAVRLIDEIGSALDYIHSQGIIHRDVKSSNIMLDKSGRSYLADFGLVLLAEVGTRGEIFGSPHYLAPEQAISSAKAVPQSDLYSLGVIAYEMFTGQLPFDAPEPLDIAMLHMSQEPPLPSSIRPDLPKALEAVLMKALAKKPEDRYPDGASLAKAIKSALAVPGRSSSVSKTTSKTIPERVALDLENRPLPPLAAAPAPKLTANIQELYAPTRPDMISPQVSEPLTVQAGEAPMEAEAAAEIPPITPLPSESPAAPAPEPRPASPSKMPSVLGILGMVVLCLVLGCLGLYALGRASLAGIAAISSLATKTPRPTATITPSPTPTAIFVSMEMVGCGSGHCLGILNHSPVDLPLASLVISGKGVSIKGSDWGVSSLPPDGCLVLTVNPKRWLPSPVQCHPGAATVTSDTNFWKVDLQVQFANVSYGICPASRQGCDFNIPLTPNPAP